MIIAVDFDGTLVTDAYPDIGAPVWGIVNIIKEHQKAGDKIILWTCRTGAALIEAIDYCRWELDLVFDAVNDNLPEKIAEHGCNCRKVYADVYVDDKNMLIRHGYIIHDDEKIPFDGIYKT